MSERKDRERQAAAREADMVHSMAAVAIESLRRSGANDDFIAGAIAALEDVAKTFRGRADRWRAKVGEP